jgi:hypothetical protein
MPTQPTIEPARSPIPGIIPEPVAVHHDTEAADRRFALTSTVRGTIRRTRSRGRSNPTGTVLAKILTVIRSDKRTAASRRRRAE